MVQTPTGWKVVYRYGPHGNKIEWNCPHGIGHGHHRHGCDGCCKLLEYPGKCVCGKLLEVDDEGICEDCFRSVYTDLSAMGKV